MDIKEEVIKENQLNSGGAQYLIKNVTSDFWYRVYTDCEQLFPQITHLNQIKKQQDPSHHEIQIWCADMWAVLWGIWRLGIETKIDPKLNFTWASSPKEEWEINSLFHNAGVADNDGKMFFKGAYQHQLPYNEELTFSPYYASVHYYELVKEVGRNINC